VGAVPAGHEGCPGAPRPHPAGRRGRLERPGGQEDRRRDGLFHAGYLHCWRREADLVRDRAERLLQLVDEHDFPLWRALGTCLLGAANTAMGQVEEGLAKVRQGVDLYQGLRTPPVFWPMLRALEAGAYAQAGRVEEALVMVDEALEISGRGSGTTVLPEFQLLKGDLLLALGQGDGADPEALVPAGARPRPALGRQDVPAASRGPALPAPPGPGPRDSGRPAARRLRHLHRRLRHGRSDRGTGPARIPSLDAAPLGGSAEKVVVEQVGHPGRVAPHRPSALDDSRAFDVFLRGVGGDGYRRSFGPAEAGRVTAAGTHALLTSPARRLSSVPAGCEIRLRLCDP
jgi:hypothetical protein